MSVLIGVTDGSSERCGDENRVRRAKEGEELISECQSFLINEANNSWYLHLSHAFCVNNFKITL